VPIKNNIGGQRTTRSNDDFVLVAFSSRISRSLSKAMQFFLLRALFCFKYLWQNVNARDRRARVFLLGKHAEIFPD
jgi:hypothetical protein